MSSTGGKQLIRPNQEGQLLHTVILGPKSKDSITESNTIELNDCIDIDNKVKGQPIYPQLASGDWEDNI